MALSDQDLGAQFAGAKRFRARFAEVSLAEERGRAAVERMSEATADIAGASSALDDLGHEVKASGEPIYRTAKGRLDDGKTKLLASQSEFEVLEKQHQTYASELDGELGGLDPDAALGRLVQAGGQRDRRLRRRWWRRRRRPSRAQDIEAGVKRVAASAIAPPEVRWVDGGLTRARPLEHSWLKSYSALLAPLPVIAAGAAGFGFFNAFPMLTA